jgi:hypothetical protein
VPARRLLEPEPTKFRLCSSADGGRSWTDAGFATPSRGLRARVVAGPGPGPHTFAVAGVNASGTGAWSVPSPPVHAAAIDEAAVDEAVDEFRDWLARAMGDGGGDWDWLGDVLPDAAAAPIRLCDSGTL